MLLSVPFQTTTHPFLLQKPLSLQAPSVLSCPLSPSGSCHWPFGYSSCSQRILAPSVHYLLQHLSVSCFITHRDLDFTCDCSASQFQKHPLLAQILLPTSPHVGVLPHRDFQFATSSEVPPVFIKPHTLQSFISPIILTALPLFLLHIQVSSSQLHTDEGETHAWVHTTQHF